MTYCETHKIRRQMKREKCKLMLDTLLDWSLRLGGQKIKLQISINLLSRLHCRRHSSRWRSFAWKFPSALLTSCCYDSSVSSLCSCSSRRIVVPRSPAAESAWFSDWSESRAWTCREARQRRDWKSPFSHTSQRLCSQTSRRASKYTDWSPVSRRNGAKLQPWRK